jgi:hypothetical protein
MFVDVKFYIRGFYDFDNFYRGMQYVRCENLEVELNFGSYLDSICMADEQPLLGLKSRPRFRPKFVQVLTQVCFKNSKLKPTPTKAYFAHGCKLITAAGPALFPLGTGA